MPPWTTAPIPAPQLVILIYEQRTAGRVDPDTFSAIARAPHPNAAGCSVLSTMLHTTPTSTSLPRRPQVSARSRKREIPARPGSAGRETVRHARPSDSQAVLVQIGGFRAGAARLPAMSAAHRDRFLGIALIPANDPDPERHMRPAGCRARHHRVPPVLGRRSERPVRADRGGYGSPPTCSGSTPLDNDHVSWLYARSRRSATCPYLLEAFPQVLRGT